MSVAGIRRGPYKRKDPFLRFSAKYVVRPDGCWEWTGAPGSHGYGEFGVGGNRYRVLDLAHRWAWLLYRGALPTGCDIHHTCSNRRCVNPDHLEALSHREHASRHGKERGKNIKIAIVAREKTHCIRGHPFAGDNLRIARNGGRCCRQCARDHAREHYHRNKHKHGYGRRALREAP